MADTNILYFPCKRGRPKKIAAQETDLGTPELQAKRAEHLTMEPLDLCLHLKLITPEQHWCGIHLRWLYTLKYGAPSVKALDLAPLGNITPAQDDPIWRAEREEEYTEAMELLRSGHCEKAVLALCVHHERPKLLTRSHLPHTLIKGLETLRKHWKR